MISCKKFKKFGKLTKPEKGTLITRQKISNVDVDVIVNCKKSKISNVYAHGGGFVYGGNNATYICYQHYLDCPEATIYAVDYKTSPEHKFPVARNEVVAVYKSLLQGGHKNIVLLVILPAVI
jgi:acetyl esterase/lipase